MVLPARLNLGAAMWLALDNEKGTEITCHIQIEALTVSVLLSTHFLCHGDQ